MLRRRQGCRLAKVHAPSALRQYTQDIRGRKRCPSCADAAYLQQWYAASRREPYYDSHRRDTSFWGYWSWEAAAITCVLDIDDSGYRGAPFYPADLVAFCRMNGIAPGATAATQDTQQQRLDEA
ncbi:DUF1911 domain-containing protein [Janthinobacterium agaricidamnosum]|uniref:DUF1911 domain-containing protein n=1 Tax=Janthinobacterium agaricidamnosum TaxID=55508 RepID=A0A3G2E7G1_9BURK|nr:DUF1911 domain-containing protein [Janthinobacterium agaricidamnosum]